MSNARQMAVSVLNQSRTASVWASELVENIFAAQPPGNDNEHAASDRRMVTQLVYGVIRRKATLDTILKPFVNRPFNRVEPSIIDVLRIGAYQLAFLTQIPPHAAVNETVELARFVGSPMARGFVNGVLRRVAELVTDEYTDTPTSSALPVDSDSSSRQNRYRHLSTAVFPDPKSQFVEYLSDAFSWPYWLADRWFRNHGRDECLRLGFWFNTPPSVWLRVNSLHGDRAAYQQRLAADSIDAEPGEHPQSLRLMDGVPIRKLPGYDHGDFCVQDHSSMVVASALEPLPGMKILDLCAAPGGKTTHLAELMQNSGTIAACDIEVARLNTVTTLAQRLGISIIQPHLLDKFVTKPPDGLYDAVLVDVPCSNSGVLGRRPEVRWRLKPDDFEELIPLQTRLLSTALDHVRRGGCVVYSTCSIEPEENSGVVRNICRTTRGLVIEAESIAIPGQPADGGYWARIRRPK